MTLFVDTSVWSLALRRDTRAQGPEVEVLRRALDLGEQVVTTGLVLQELLQGFAGPTARDAIIERFASVPLLVPSREDHVQAAELRNLCRRRGIQIGTIDALLAQLCIRHELTLLTTDTDFTHMEVCCPLQIWRPWTDTAVGCVGSEHCTAAMTPSTGPYVTPNSATYSVTATVSGTGFANSALQNPHRHGGVRVLRNLTSDLPQAALNVLLTGRRLYVLDSSDPEHLLMIAKGSDVADREETCWLFATWLSYR